MGRRPMFCKTHWPWSRFQSLGSFGSVARCKFEPTYIRIVPWAKRSVHTHKLSRLYICISACMHVHYQVLSEGRAKLRVFYVAIAQKRKGTQLSPSSIHMYPVHMTSEIGSSCKQFTIWLSLSQDIMTDVESGLFLQKLSHSFPLTSWTHGPRKWRNS